MVWANVRNAAPKSALGKTLTYLKEQWLYLTNYPKDGRLEFSNNRAEHGIRPFVIDRKTFLFANTHSGARGSVVTFTMIQTAIENQLDPYRYLTRQLKAANTAATRPFSGRMAGAAIESIGFSKNILHFSKKYITMILAMEQRVDQE